MPASLSDPPPVVDPKLLDDIETAGRALLLALPHSPHPQAILDRIAAQRRALNRRPLPEGWRWRESSRYLLVRGDDPVCHLAMANGRSLVIFASEASNAEVVKEGYGVDEDDASAMVEDWLCEHGWPT